MVKRLKLFLWFIKESKNFIGKGYIEMLFKEQLIQRAIYFVKQTIFDERMIEKYGADEYYANMNREIEV